MKIDTLVLSGGSIKGISFLGCLKYLMDNNYIDSRLKNIKKIYCVSASIIFILSLILLDFDYDYIESEMINFDYNSLLNINDISINNFINDYGFINYNRNYIYIQKLLKEKYNCESMSLKRFYN